MLSSFYFVVLLGVLMVAQVLTTVLADDILSLEDEDLLREAASRVLRCGNIPGLSITIVQGSDSWTLPLGVANVTSEEPVRANTRFAIGSLTKAFTSTLLVALLGESPLNWTVDTPVRTILGRDDLFSDEVRSDQATVKDILSHRLGLSRGDLALFAGFPSAFTPSDVVSRLSCLQEQKPFRDGFLYNNLLYILAGHVVERLTNQSFYQVLQSRLLVPLGMSSTGHCCDFSPTVTAEDKNYGKLAQPYLFTRGSLVPADPALFRLDPFLPALGLVSNSHDMTRWLQLQLNRGVAPHTGRRVLPRGVIETTHAPVVPTIVNRLRPRFSAPDLTFAYSLGWRQAVYKGYRRAWHAGSLFGFVSQVWLYPDLDLGLYVAANSPGADTDRQGDILTNLLYFVTDLVLGDTPWFDTSSLCERSRLGSNRSHQPSASDSMSSSHTRKVPPKHSQQDMVQILESKDGQPLKGRTTGHNGSQHLSPRTLKNSSKQLLSNKLLQTRHSLQSPPPGIPPAMNNSNDLPHSHEAKFSRLCGIYMNNLFGNVSIFPRSDVDAHPKASLNDQRLMRGDNRNHIWDNKNYNLPIDVPLATENNISSTYLTPQLQALFGERLTGDLTFTKVNHRTDLSAPGAVWLFQMEPTGIFEFSAYKSNNDIFTMPVLFSDFDSAGIPQSLQAVWNPQEVITFRRESSVQRCTQQSSFPHTKIDFKTSNSSPSITVMEKNPVLIVIVFLHCWIHEAT